MLKDLPPIQSLSSSNLFKRKSLNEKISSDKLVSGSCIIDTDAEKMIALSALTINLKDHIINKTNNLTTFPSTSAFIDTSSQSRRKSTGIVDFKGMLSPNLSNINECDKENNNDVHPTVTETLDLIYSAVGNYSTIEKAFEAIKAVDNICNRSYHLKSLLGYLNIHEMLIKLMKTHYTNIEFVQIWYKAISSFVKNDDINKSKMGSSGLCDILVGQIYKHYNNPEIIKLGFILMYDMANSTITCQSLQNNQVVKRLLRGLYHYRHVSETVDHVLKNLKYDKDFDKEIELPDSPRATPVLIKANSVLPRLDRTNQNKRSASFSGEINRSLLISSNSNTNNNHSHVITSPVWSKQTSNKLLFSQAGGCEAIIFYLNSDNIEEHIDCFISAIQLITSLSINETIANIFIESDIHSYIMNLLDKYYLQIKYEELTSKCFSCLVILSGHSKYKVKVGNDIIIPLNSILQHYHNVVIDNKASISTRLSFRGLSDSSLDKSADKPIQKYIDQILWINMNLCKGIKENVIVLLKHDHFFYLKLLRKIVKQQESTYIDENKKVNSIKAKQLLDIIERYVTIVQDDNIMLQ